MRSLFYAMVAQAMQLGQERRVGREGWLAPLAARTGLGPQQHHGVGGVEQEAGPRTRHQVPIDEWGWRRQAAGRGEPGERQEARGVETDRPGEEMG